MVFIPEPGLDSSALSTTRRERKIEEGLLHRPSKRRARDEVQQLDIAFLVGASNTIKELSRLFQIEITSIATEICRVYPLCQTRFALVLYSDYEYGDDTYAQACDFTNSYSVLNHEFSRTLAKIAPNRQPEDVITGLECVADLDWQATNRLLIHVTDIPCREGIFLDASSCAELLDDFDEYLETDDHDRNIEIVLRQLREHLKLNRYCVVHLNESTVTMAKFLRRASLDDSGTWLMECSAEDNEFSYNVVDMALMSISTSLNVLVKGDLPESEDSTVRRNSKCKFRQIKLEKNLSLLAELWAFPRDGVVLTLRPLSSLHEILEMISKRRDDFATSDAFETEKVLVSLARFPFELGASRWQYHALVSVNGCFSGQFDCGAINVIAKKFKQPLGKAVAEVNSRQAYIKEMEVMEVASYVSRELDKHLRCGKHYHYFILEFSRLVFLRTSLLSGPKFSTFYSLQEPTGGAEFKDADEKARVALEAFSHFSYYISSGTLLITGMCGTRTSRDLRIRKVTIHTKYGKKMPFSRYDLGSKGIQNFLDGHKCNKACVMLKLPPCMDGCTGVRESMLFRRNPQDDYVRYSIALTTNPHVTLGSCSLL